MSVQLVETPDVYGLTKGGRMTYVFSGSGRYITLGTKAKCLLFVASPVIDGTKLTLRWNGQARTLTFKNTPSQPGEFTTGDGSADYLDNLLDELKGYYPIREDFILTRNEPDQIPGIYFTARQPGPAYDISVGTLPVGTPFGFGTTVYGANPLTRTQYSIYVEIWLQKLGTPGTNLDTDYERLLSPPVECDENGIARINVGNVIHAKLEKDWPQWGSSQAPTDSPNSGRKYIIASGEAWGSPLQIGHVSFDQIRYAYLGGADYINQSGSGLPLNRFMGATAALDRALRYGSYTRYILPNEPQFLTFLNQRGTQTDTLLKVTLTLDNGDTVVRTDLYAPQTVAQGEKITYPVGPLHLQLSNLVPAGRNLVEYSVQRVSANGLVALSVPYRYLLNGEYRPYTRFFAFLNSLGCVETLTTYGKGSYELNLFAEQAQHYLAHHYDVSEGQFAPYDLSTQQQIEVTTGFWPESVLRDWTDFYRSPNKFDLSSGRALPIGLVSKSIQQQKDGDNLFAHKFQYVFLYKDDFYTLDETASIGDTPPPPNFQPGGQVTIELPTIVHAVDDTIPDFIRQDFTQDLFNKMRIKAAEPNPETLGFLKQESADQLYFPSNRFYTRSELNLTDVPTITEVEAMIGEQAGTLDEVTRRTDLTEEWQESPGLMAAADNVADEDGKRLIRFMTWARAMANLVVNITPEYVKLFAAKLAQFFTLNDILGFGNIADENIILRGNHNYITLQAWGQPASDRGHIHLIENEDGSRSVGSFSGHAADGSRVTIVAGKIVEKTTASQKIYGVSRLEASATAGWFKSIGIKSLATTEVAESIVVPNWDTNEVGDNLRKLSMRDLSKMLAKHGDPVVFANWLRDKLGSGNGSNGGGESDVFVVQNGHLYCRPVEDTGEEPGTGGGGSPAEDYDFEADINDELDNDDPIDNPFAGRRVYNVLYYGARGTGVVDDSDAIQAAIDAASVMVGDSRRPGEVYFPGNQYRIDKGLNVTNTRLPGTLLRDGIVLRGESKLGTQLLGRTGGEAMIDLTGSQWARVESMALFSDTTAPLAQQSTLGIYTGIFAALEQTQNQQYDNVIVIMPDMPLANGFQGTIAFSNTGAEENTHTNVWYRANSPVVLKGANNPPYEHYKHPLLGVPHSLGVTSFLGYYIECLGNGSTAVTTEDVNSLWMANGYIKVNGLDSSAFDAFGGMFNAKLGGTIEGGGRVMNIYGALSHAEIRFQLANVIEPSKSIFELKRGGQGWIIDSNIKIIDNTGDRRLLTTDTPANVDEKISCYVRNTIFNSSKPLSFSQLPAKVLWNPKTESVTLYTPDKPAYYIESSTQHRTTIPIKVIRESSGGATSANILRLNMPPLVANNMGQSVLIEIEGLLSMGYEGSDSIATRKVNVSIAVSARYSDGQMKAVPTVTLGNQVALNSAGTIDNLSVSCVATGNSALTIGFSPQVTEGIGEKVQFGGTVTMTAIGHCGDRSHILIL
ncbi:glycosyl hydrolase family 28-related protein [Spirosoma fluminis]